MALLPRGKRLMASVRFVVVLVLLGLCLWSLGAGIALAQGGTLIEGQVVNGTAADGDLEGMTVVLHQQGMGEYAEVETTTDPQGRFRFPDVEVVPGFAYGVSVTYQGVLYGQDLALILADNDPVTLTIYETTEEESVLKTTAASTLFASVDRRGRWVGVLEMVSLQNDSDRTYVPGPEPMKLLRFGLPSGAQDLQVETDLLGGEVLQVDLGFGLTSPVPPGAHDLLFSYRFPYDESTVSFSKSLPYGATQLRVLISEGDVRVTSPQMGAPNTVAIGSHTYQVLAVQDLGRGTRVDLALEGLPQPTAWERVARYGEEIPFQYVPPVALAIAAALVMAYAVLQSRRRRSLSGIAAGGSPLVEARQEVMQALVTLDQRLEREGMDPSRYQEERGRLVRRLAALGREQKEGGPMKLDSEGSSTPAHP